MEVSARAHWGHFSSAGRVDSQRKENCTALISSKCPFYKYEYVPTMLLMELSVICHSLWQLLKSVKIIWVKCCRYGLPFNAGIQCEDKGKWTYLSLLLRNSFTSYSMYCAALNYTCSLTQEVYCCFLFSDALVHLEVKEHWGMTAPSGPTENAVRRISDALLKILPKQYHISPTQWHSLENKAKKSEGANQLKPNAQASRDR